MTRLIISILIFMAGAGTHVSAQVSNEYLQLADSTDNYIKKERWKDAERVIKKALRLDPANSANFLLFSNLGIVRTHLGDIPGALQAYEIGLSRAPNSTAILTNRAYTYLTANRPEDALSDFNKALERDSILEWPLRMRAAIELEKGDYKSAIRDFECYNRHYALREDVMIGLGKISLATGDSQKSEEYFKKALEIDKNEETFFYVALVEMEMQKLSEAAEILRDGIAKFPQAGNLYLLRGRLHKMSFRNEEALVDKKMAINNNADPQLVELYFPSSSK